MFSFSRASDFTLVNKTTMDTVPEFDHEQAMKELVTKPRQSEWEAYVSRFQNTSAEATADDKWQVMERIYEMNSKWR